MQVCRHERGTGSLAQAASIVRVVRTIKVARLRPPALRDLLWWLLVSLNALFGAILFWTLITPLSPVGQWRPSAVRMPSLAERAALFATVDPFNRTTNAAVGSDTAAVTSLALTLYATRAMPGGGGSAILAGSDGVQTVVQVGTEVQPGIKLVAVAFDHVILTHNGAREMLYLDQSGSAPTATAVVAANPVKATGMQQADTAGAPITVQSVRSGIGFGPRAAGGRVVGLEVMPQGDGNVFRTAGFQPGDLVTAVNGQPVRGAGDTALLVGALQPGSTVTITVQRGGRQLPLAIKLGQ